MLMKKSNDTIGNRTRDLPTCSAVPQPTALPRAPINASSWFYYKKYREYVHYHRMESQLGKVLRIAHLLDWIHRDIAMTVAAYVYCYLYCIVCLCVMCVWFFFLTSFMPDCTMTEFVNLRNDMYVQKEYPIELPTIGQYKHSVKWYPEQPDLSHPETLYSGGLSHTMSMSSTANDTRPDWGTDDRGPLKLNMTFSKKCDRRLWISLTLCEPLSLISLNYISF